MQPKEFISLSGAVAVVTGGGRGIGQAIVTSLAAMEATVVLTGRDETRVQQVASDLQSGRAQSRRVLDVMSPTCPAWKPSVNACAEPTAASTFW